MTNNNVLIKPETAAKLAAQLFPESDFESSIENVIQWLTIYRQEFKQGSFGRGTSLSPIGQKITNWNQAVESTTAQQASGELPLPRAIGGTGIRNNPEIKQMMMEVLEYAKANKISAGDLCQKIGVSYPTILNWQRGKLPRGENIQKVAEFFKQVTK